MFIRFVVGGDAEHHQSLTGIITEARLLRDKGGLTQWVLRFSLDYRRFESRWLAVQVPGILRCSN